MLYLVINCQEIAHELSVLLVNVHLNALGKAGAHGRGQSGGDGPAGSSGPRVCGVYEDPLLHATWPWACALWL